MTAKREQARTTIRSVAERAGVSVKTVSRVIGGHPNVSEATRSRVREVMAQMEYTPSAAARSLRGQHKGAVTIIADNLTTTPDSFEIVRGVREVTEREAHLLMIGETSGDRAVFATLLDEFRSQRSAAILKVTMSHQQVFVEQRVNQSPMVLVNCFEAYDRYPTVVPDDRGGSAAATSALLGLGHDRVALVGLLPDMVATRLRHHGYLEAHADAGVPVDDRLVRHAVSTTEADEFAPLADVLEELFALDEPPTAVMCGNDKMALRTLMWVQQRGHVVPDDVSVVGFDDYRLITENTLPRLSTVQLPYFEMGRHAAQLGLDRAAARRVLLPCTFVARDSTGAPSRGLTSRPAVLPRPSASPQRHPGDVG